MSARAALTVLSLCAPLAVVLLLATGVDFGDAQAPLEISIAALLAGTVAGVAAVVLAGRERRGRVAAWLAVALNVAPAAIYAVGVAIWLSSGGD